MRKLTAVFTKKLIPVYCALAVLFFAFRDDDLFQVSKNLDIFASLYKELNINYVEEINSSEFIHTGIDAMLNSLDPYTEFVPESEIEDYRLKYVSTQYGGIGASIFTKGGKVIVSEPYEGFPAQKNDIRAGDEILQINGVSTKNKTNEEVSLMLKGPKNTPLKMVFQRPGEKDRIEKTITREEIIQRNVSYYGMLNKDVGYIKLDKFLENSAQEVRDALVDLQKNNPTGVVLDLRHNGGGILQEAVKIINFFVDKDATVVTQKGKVKEKVINYRTVYTAIAGNLPLVVLVDSRSASASEIVAGSLQDLDRAIIIGERSFGKGLVQQTFNLPYNSLVKVTVAKYYTPSGRCIQALDYVHKQADGTAVKFADSLITEFKTKGGRSVYNGSGVYPDISVKDDSFHSITKTLVAKQLIFDYSTLYRNKNTAIPGAHEFQLTDYEYAGFVGFLSNKDYNYSTNTEKLLNDLKSEADKENKMPEIKSEFEALKSKVFYSKKDDLTQFKEEIKRVLENEIVSRYYFQKGRVENNFRHDEDIKAAVNVLNDKTKIASVLKGEGTYKIIGRPQSFLSARAEK